MKFKKSPLVLAAEERAGKPLEEAMPELLNTVGWKATMERLGATRGNMSYWMAQLHIEPYRVWVPPGYRLVLLPKDPLQRQIDLTEVT